MEGRMGFSPTVYVLSRQWYRSQLRAVTNGFSQSSEAQVFCPTVYTWEKKGVTMERHRKLPRAWAIQSAFLAQLASSGTHWTAYQVKWQQAQSSISHAAAAQPWSWVAVLTRLTLWWKTKSKRICQKWKGENCQITKPRNMIQQWYMCKKIEKHHI